MRICNCGESDQLNFYKDKSAKFGLRSTCKKCDINKANKWNKNNKNSHKKHQKKWREDNREISRQQVYDYRKTDKGVETLTKWNQENREYLNNKQKEFRDSHPGYSSYYANKRKDKIKIATLPNYEQEIKDIYFSCPKGYEVHHIVPLLEDPNVCGLHVPWNLEILTKEEHLQKHIKLRGNY